MASNYTLKDLIRGNKARFVRYRAGSLVYCVVEPVNNPFIPKTPDKELFEFEIPIEELQGATVNAVEPASTFMKWIRQTLKEIIDSEEAPDGS